MATPPKGPTGTTPPRRKAAARKPTRSSTAVTKAPKPPKPAEEIVADAETAPPKSVGAAASPKTKAPTKPRAPAKPRSAKKLPASTGQLGPSRRAAVADDSATPSTPTRDTGGRRDQSSNRNFLAAALGGVAALGAAAAGVFYAVKAGRSAKSDEAKPNAGATAHQPDGTDSSASFEAGIADEGTIPESV